MIKKTIYFGNPAYLSLKDNQLIIKLPGVEKDDMLSSKFKEELTTKIPIEDIGVIVIDHKQITITIGLMTALLANNCSLITCDSKSMPLGLFLPLENNTIQRERFTAQIEAPLPLKKQLWQQTIQAKIENQAYVLGSLEKTYRISIETGNMFKWAKEVRSGDPDNLEGRAAAYYWKNLFTPPLWNKTDTSFFKRDREGLPPNNLLNYGYAILRAVIARSLVSSGLLPTFGIHHHNKYNAYCLADDIMEPYRPFVDKLVIEIVYHEINNYGSIAMELTKEIKSKLLQIPVLDVVIDKQRSPLMIAAAHTTASLAKCFLGETKKVIYPTMRPS